MKSSFKIRIAELIADALAQELLPEEKDKFFLAGRRKIAIVVDVDHSFHITVLKRSRRSRRREV